MLFDEYAPRISLHHGHLAQALGQSARALACYKVAVHLAPKGDFVYAAALTGQVALRIGLWRSNGPVDLEAMDEESGLGLSKDIISSAQEAVNTCHGMGGTLEAMGHILEACLSTEILKSKYVVCSK